MKPDVKEKIRASMKEYLTKHGWPDKLTPEMIINHHLPALWKKLETEGLLKEVMSQGFGYKKFVDSAIAAKQRHDLQEAFRNKFNGWGFR